MLHELLNITEESHVIFPSLCTIRFVDKDDIVANWSALFTTNYETNCLLFEHNNKENNKVYFLT